MLLLDHISYFHSILFASFQSLLNYNLSSSSSHSRSKTFSLLFIQQLMLMLLLLLGNVGKIMKPFTQLSEKTTKSSCLMLSTTKSLLMMSHYPFLSLLAPPPLTSVLSRCRFQQSVKRNKKRKSFLLILLCKTLPSDHH